MTTSTPRQSKQRSGATIVEFAVTLPILILFLFAFFEIAHALMIDSVVENAAYEGVRRGIIPGASSDSVEKAAQDVAIASSLKSVNVFVEPNSIGPDTERITVTVSAPLKSNGLLIGTFLGNTMLKRSATMIREAHLRYQVGPDPPTIQDVSPQRPRKRK